MSLTFFDLKDISEKYIEILDPTSAEKIFKAGEIMGMKKGETIIDFGCGYAEPLVLWAEKYGIQGVGIDKRGFAVQRAAKKVFQRGLADRIQIAQADGAHFEFEPNSFDYATCIGATFIWDVFVNAVRAMKKAIKPGGKLAIGEVYWLVDNYPPECLKFYPNFNHEHELLYDIWNEGLELVHVIRSTTEDWDNYEMANWRGLLEWIDQNPEHPDRDEVIRHLHDSQDEYLHYGRKYIGWGIYVMKFK